MKLLLLTVSSLLLSSVTNQQSQLMQQITGAWEWNNRDEVHTLIITDQYYALAIYNRKGKNFVSTKGGTWMPRGKDIVLVEEFNTADKSTIGKENPRKISVTGKKMSLDLSAGKEDWTRIDSGAPGKLAGAWLITGRMTGDQMQKITPGARRTMKILSGTRFQWIAYNSETKEFFGTGGGTYTTDDGKYTEHIDFFSRDNSRIGQSLVFDFSLEDGNWRHNGLSSKGDPIDEIWTKRETLGI